MVKVKSIGYFGLIRIASLFASQLLVASSFVAATPMESFGNERIAWKPVNYWSAQEESSLSKVLVYDEPQANGAFLTEFRNSNYLEPYLGFSSYGSDCVAEEILCIEEIEVQSSGSDWLVRPVEIVPPGSASHSGMPSAHIPESTGLQVYELENPSLAHSRLGLLINYSIQGGYLVESKEIIPSYTKFDLSARFVNLDKIENFDNFGSNMLCASPNTSVCYQELEFPLNTVISLTVRAPKYVGGWFYGRMKDYTISVDNSDADFNRISISGESTRVQAIDSVFPALGNEEVHRKLWPWPTPVPDKVNIRWDGSVGPPAALAVAAMKEILADSASGTYDAWSVSSASSSSTNQCLADNSRVLGIVTTNALAYSRSIPTFESGYFEYSVSGLHHNESGETQLGTFEFVMRSDVARCLYGFTKAPVSATVTVTEVDGVENVATTFASERDGWLKLAAYDFTFSEKEIKVKLTQPYSVTLTKFTGSTKELSSKQKAEIKSAVTKAKSNPKFICTGIRLEGQPQALNNLVRQRAKLACDFAKALNPKLSTFVQTKTTKERSFNGKVMLVSK